MDRGLVTRLTSLPHLPLERSLFTVQMAKEQEAGVQGSDVRRQIRFPLSVTFNALWAHLKNGQVGLQKVAELKMDIPITLGVSVTVLN